MKFYSYEYLTSRIAVTNRLQLILAAAAAVLLVFALFKYYRERRDTKYRELSLIALFGVLALICARISSEQSLHRIDDQYSSAAHAVETVAEELKLDKATIYINTQAARDGAVVKAGDDFYRIIAVDGGYLLEKMEVIDPEIQLVDAD